MDTTESATCKQSAVAEESLYAWLHEPHGRVFNNLTIPGTARACEELAKITGEGLMEVAARAGARVAIFDGRNQFYAFHDGPVCRKHPGLGERDLVAEMIEAGERLGIVYVPYLPMDCDQRAWEEHPDWRIVDWEGKERPDTMPRLCKNSPFGQYLADYLRDLAARYRIGGFWFDGSGVSQACYCRYCREGFKQAHDREAPASAEENPDSWRLWLEYKEHAVARALALFMEAGRSVKPGLPVCTAWVPGVRASSQKWYEACWTWPTATLQLLRGDTGATAEFYIPGHQYAPSHPITLTTQELRDRAMTSIASGCIPDFTLTSRPERIRVINEELAARADWLVDTKPVKYAGVVFSENSQFLCEKDRWKDGPAFTFYGVLRSLLEEKVPETCLSDYNLEHDDLSDYAVLVLPDTGIISDAAAKRLREFVENGGGLLAGARTSLCDRSGTEMADFALADLLGVHFKGRLEEKTPLPSWDTIVQTGEETPNSIRSKLIVLGDHEIVNDDLIRETLMTEVVPAFRRGHPTEYTLSYPGEMLKVEADADTKMIAWEQYQEPGRQWPFMTVREVGKGRVVYLAANLGFQYASHWTWPYVRRLLANAVRWAAGGHKPQFEVDSLLQVQATLFRQKNPRRTVLHLLNAPDPQGFPPFTRQTWEGYFTSCGRQREDIAPVTDIRVRLLGNFRKIYMAPGGEKLAVGQVGEYAEVTVPRLDTHCMVVGEE
jgi:type 1 glutamine amidotransferase